MITIYDRKRGNGLGEVVRAGLPDTLDLKRTDLPTGLYIADRNGELFAVSIYPYFEGVRSGVKPIITEPVVKFVRHHSRAIPKGTIALVVNGRNPRYIKIMTSSGISVYVNSDMVRNHYIDRLCPKKKEWAVMAMLGNGLR